MDGGTRREVLRLAAAVGAAAAGRCVAPSGRRAEGRMRTGTIEGADAIVRVKPLGFTWETRDPFLFCVHHDDAYPAGDEAMGPAASLAGRAIGQDFELRDGWRMYHGRRVPGFPQHPHRGFETVTIVRRGMLDHSDSLGAAARYGGGDVQWLTAGRGILHAEMFPLRERQAPNPVELFQIWVNLPRVDKMVAPHFAMLWREHIPRHVAHDDAGRATTVSLVAGRLGDLAGPAPPPHSWASRPDGDVAIWTIAMAPGARWTLPAARRGTQRDLFFFRGSALRAGGHALAARHGVELRGEVAVTLENGPDEAELLVLQARPIREPAVQHGPFVMNSREEIAQTWDEFRRTRFGGWPWTSDEPVHPREEGRFARHADGHLERRG